MEYDKSMIEKIIGLEDWSKFEAFISSLYEKHDQAIEVIKNYRAIAKSGRKREVDVLVSFGVNPHILTLGIECKYWNKKVDGDVIDVVKNKKDDLGIDKFAVITIVGYELGAEQYAKNAGIDLFIIRPINDDDFGYSGKEINFRFSSYGSAFTDIRVGGELISESGATKENIKFVSDKLSFIHIKNFDSDFDHTYDLYNYNEYLSENGGRKFFQKLEFKKNLFQVIMDSWKTFNDSYYHKLECTPNISLIFKSNYAIFFSEKNIIFKVKQVSYHIRFFLQKWDFTIDRSLQHPVVLENIIEKTITPLKQNLINNETIFKMDETIKVVPIDITQKPSDVVGRGGLDIKYLLSKPMTGPFKNEEHNKTYELIQEDGKSVYKIVNE
jgi:hypothetical protein